VGFISDTPQARLVMADFQADFFGRFSQARLVMADFQALLIEA
jgi:hypothetical protein